MDSDAGSPRSVSWDLLGLGLALAGYLILTLSGLDWGVPTALRCALEPPVQQVRTIPAEKIERSWDYWRSRGREPQLHEGYGRDLFNPIRSYHADEYVILKSLSNMRPSAWDFDPRIYLYPSLHFYCVGAALEAARLVGFVHVVKDLFFYMTHPHQMARMYIVGRVLTVLFGVASIVAVFLIARRLGGGAGLAALALALSPAFVIHSHYMTRDVMSACWSSLLVLSCMRLVQSGKSRWYVLGAVFAGLCAGTNYMWLIAWGMVLVAHGLAAGSGRRRWLDPWLLVSLLVFAAVFALAAFYALKDPAKMAADFRSEVIHWSGARLLSRGLGFAWVSHLVGLLPAMFGYPLAVLVIGGLAATVYEAVTRRDHLDLLVLAWLISVWLVVGMDGRDYSRYYVIIVPLLALLAARALVFVWSRAGLSPLLRTWPRPVTALIGLVAVAYAAALSVAWSQLFATENVRTEAGVWIVEHVPRGATLAMTKPAWQYEMPPISSTRYRIVVTGEDKATLDAGGAEWFVTSSAQYEPVLRDRTSPVFPFWQSVLDGDTLYSIEKAWVREPRLAGFLLPTGWIPEDMTYVNPTVVLYRRRSE